jgi:hypothetical protein
MPIRVIKVFVAICPICEKRISCSGECEWDVWPTRTDLHEALEYGTEEAETWDQRIAYSCGSACEVEYIKRRRAIRDGKGL